MLYLGLVHFGAAVDDDRIGCRIFHVPGVGGESSEPVWLNHRPTSAGSSDRPRYARGIMLGAPTFRIMNAST